MKKAIIELDGNALNIDGIRVGFDVIPQILYDIANPDPRKWYRFERIGNELIVETKFYDPSKQSDTISVEVSNGNFVRERSRSSEDVGQQRAETAYPLDADRPHGQ